VSGPRVVAGERITLPSAIARAKPNLSRHWAAEPEGRGTTLHDIVTKILARQQLLIRPGPDGFIDARITARVIRHGVGQFYLGPSSVIKAIAIRKRLRHCARMEVRGIIVEVLAARDGDQAEPVLVCRRTVSAITR